VKKKIYLLATIFLTIGLTACNFTSEEVEEFTESYCRENPNSEICQGEIQDNLQDEAIETLFFNMLDDYNQNTNDFCDTYFSITNLEILDACRNNKSALFPSSLDGYFVESIDYDDGYKVTLYKDIISPSYIFNIVIVSDEAGDHIDEWKIQTIPEETQDPSSVNVKDSDAETVIKLFIEEYANENISSSDFCYKYYPYTDDTTCETNRTRHLLGQLQIAFVSLEQSTNGTIANLTVNYPGYVQPAPVQVVFQLTYRSDLSVETVIMSPLPFDPSSMYFNHEVVYNTIVDLLLDAPIPDDICSMYFDEDTWDSCVHFHNQVQLNNIEVAISGFTTTTTGYNVTYTLTYPDRTETVNSDIILSFDGINIEISHSFPNLGTYTEEQMLTLVLERLNDPTISDETACVYSVSSFQTTCELLHETLVDEDIVWELHSMELSDTIVEVTIEQVNRDTEAFISYIDLDMMLVSGDILWTFDIINSFEYTEPMAHHAYRFFFPLAMTAQYDDVSDADYCALYGVYFDDCMLFKERINDHDFIVDYEDLNDIDYSDEFEFELYLIDDEDEIIYTYIFLFDFALDEADMLLIDGGQISELIPPPHDEYYDIINAYLEAYLDETNTDQDIYDAFNEGMIMMGMYRRDYIVTQGLSYEILDVTWAALGYNFQYTATVRFTREGFSKDVELQYELFPRATTGYNLFIVENLDLITETELNNYITKLLIDFTDTDIETADFCRFYFLDTDYITCYDLRHQVLRDNYMISLNEVLPSAFTVFFNLDFIHPDLTATTLSFSGSQYRDILHNPHLALQVSYSDPDLLEDLNTYLNNGLVYGFNLHGINLTTFCNEFAVCAPDSFDSLTEQIHQVDNVTAYWDFFDLRNPHLVAVLKYEFMDGDIVFHKYTATYTLDEDDYKVWLLTYEGKYYPIPLDANSQDLTTADTLFGNFIDDFDDPLVSLSTLSDTYFGGKSVYSLSGFMRYRTLALNDNATVTYTPLELYMNQTGVLIFSTTVTINFTTYTTYIMEYHVIMYTNADGNYIVFTY
jgi:hypothetical protein